MSNRPDWTDAACHGAPDQTFYPSTVTGRGSHRRFFAAKAICNGCPIAAKCLEYALENETETRRYGVWGGTSPEERSTIARRRWRDSRKKQVAS